MLAVRTGLSPVMIGRAAELARLRELRLHHRRPHPRERELAALVAEGCSNGEVARRLYISTKTASVHVSNILAKLGMTSRTEVAAWAVRTGLAPSGRGG